MQLNNAGIVAVALCATGGIAGSALAGATFHAPTQYTSLTNSPWAGENTNLIVEDFEDGELDAPGLTADAGDVRAPGQYTDSVDFDDGLLDGWGQNGYSYLTTDGAAGITFNFELIDRGTTQYPTIAGLVWTDGNWASMITFEAWDASGEYIGSVQHLLGDENDGTGQTGEDRFLGLENEGGISAIRISTEFGGIEVDHVQYGTQPIPAPAAISLLGLAGLAVRRRRRA